MHCCPPALHSRRLELTLKRMLEIQHLCPCSENRTGLYLETAGILSFARNLLPNGTNMRQVGIRDLGCTADQKLPQAP